METNKIIKIKAVSKPPQTGLYRYVRRLCDQCGSIHYYRKNVDITENELNVRFECPEEYQPWLVGEEATLKQTRLF